MNENAGVDEKTRELLDLAQNFVDKVVQSLSRSESRSENRPQSSNQPSSNREISQVAHARPPRPAGPSVSLLNGQERINQNFRYV